MLIGGLGKDTMNGGAGADTYVVTNINESGNTIALADVINGWDASDKIDFSAIDADTANPGTAGNQAFTFGGVDDTVDLHEVSVFQNGADTVVHLDTDGVAGAEMMIVLLGVTAGTLTGAHFDL